MKRIITAVLLAGLAGQALAFTDAYNGYVTRVFDKNGVIFIGIQFDDPVEESLPVVADCVAEGQERQLRTAAGEDPLLKTILLDAMLNTLHVSVYPSGECTGGYETIRKLSVQPAFGEPV